MHERLRVLVADDDASMLDVISTWLEQQDANVVRARTGSDLVLSLAEHGPFDLVITDIAMPWMDGLEAMRSVRHVGLTPCVIFITGSDDRALDRRVAELGRGTALLRKPLQLNELQSIMNRVLEARSSSDERRGRHP
jgi:two-component system cell cycle response regulator CpdR